jgi:putative drug exporter of the RND superfamily
MIARLTRVLYACGRACVRFRWPVIAAWIAVAVVLHLAAASAGEDWTDNLTLPGTGSTRATDLLQERLPQQAYGSIPISLRDPHGTIGDSASKDAIDRTVKNLNAVPHVIRVVSPLDPSASALVSKDGKIAYISVSLDIGSGDTSVDEAQAVLDAADPAKAAGLEVAVGGYVGQKLSKPATESSEAIGLAAAVVILVFAFGTVTAMTLPIVTAIVGLIITLALVTLVGHSTDVPNISPTLATMIGLGVGIDYALFIVTKHKLQLAEGMEMRESIARACATAGGAVVFAGITVAIALCSLLVAGIPLVTTLGFTAAIAVVVSVLAAITLLPALLGVLGERIHSLAVHVGSSHPDDNEPHGWARMARAVGRRPWPALIGSVVLLLVLALPLLQLRLGQSDTSAMPKSTTIRQSYDTITDGFGAGTNGPLLIAVELDSPASGDPTKDPRLTGLQSAVAKTPGVQSVTPLTVDKDGTAAVFTAVATTAPAADETEDLVDNLRDTVIPNAVAGTGTAAYVGGQTAGYIDLAEKIAAKLPLMIAVVVLLSLVVLLLAFRSVVIPLKAAVMNLLSVAAAYGVVTAVFQEGWGAGAVGLPHAIPIVSFAPLLMFAILFGLSMDYEVFLVTQMQEHYLESGDAKEAVVDGLAATGRVITSAALVMVCVFTSFVLNGDPTVKEFGVGLAFAIAIDATVVRCMLVPAVMELLGERSWWIPAWLDRVLPRVSIEGQGFFDDEAEPEPEPEPVAEPEPVPTPQTNAGGGRSEAPADPAPTPEGGTTMSVTMMLRVKADAKRLQEVINGNEARTQAVNDRGKSLGAIHHRFLASADGTEIIVIDEWESAEGFQKFFESSPEIAQIMAETGVTSEPEVSFWHEVDTIDKF